MLSNFLILFQASGRQLARRALAVAEREFVSHGLQAEYHGAMALMYSERCQRLRAIVEPEPVSGLPEIDVGGRS